MDDLFIKTKMKLLLQIFARFGLNVMGIQDQGDDMANAKAGIVALQSFIKDELHLPTSLSEVGIMNENLMS